MKILAQVTNTFPISKWLNFAKPKITLRVEPRKNDREEDVAEECGALCFGERILSLHVLLNPNGILQR
jgi:hypothetical protein